MYGTEKFSTEHTSVELAHARPNYTNVYKSHCIRHMSDKLASDSKLQG